MAWVREALFEWVSSGGRDRKHYRSYMLSHLQLFQLLAQVMLIEIDPVLVLLAIATARAATRMGVRVGLGSGPGDACG